MVSIAFPVLYRNRSYPFSTTIFWIYLLDTCNTRGMVLFIALANINTENKGNKNNIIQNLFLPLAISPHCLPLFSVFYVFLVAQFSLNSPPFFPHLIFSAIPAWVSAVAIYDFPPISSEHIVGRFRRLS